MPGLFTLGSETLGVIGANALGGPGTGFTDGSTTSAGTVAGVQGFTGSASGSTTATGSATGTAGFIGSVTGSATTVGSVVGREGDQGVIGGTSTSAGSVAGTPSLLGAVTGLATSAGSVTGTPYVPTPPAPPVPAPSGGGSAYPATAPRPRRPQPTPQPTHHSGRARGASVARSTVVGMCNHGGRVNASTATTGTCSGIRWPSDALVAMWKRQAMEQDLLTLELL